MPNPIATLRFVGAGGENGGGDNGGLGGSGGGCGGCDGGGKSETTCSTTSVRLKSSVLAGGVA